MQFGHIVCGLNNFDMTKRENNEEHTDSKDFMENGKAPNGCCSEEQQGADSAKVAGEEDSQDDNSSEVSEEQNAANEWRDKYLRLSAEFDNYRKRTLKEKAELTVMGGERVIKSLLPVLDDMDRALDAMQNSEDIESVRSGIELIGNKMRDMLSAEGLKEIEAIGLELDTDFHEAVATTPAPNRRGRGKIVDVAQKGYTFKDKVVRHSKVVVGE